MSRHVEIKSTEVMAQGYFTLTNVTYEMGMSNGTTEELKREVYMTANGATVLLYNKERGTVILTRQFRLPTYINKNPDGKMIETCAGIVDNDEDPDTTIIREIEEETGYKVDRVDKLFELYTSPGSVTEILHYYTAEYVPADKAGAGGGLDEENEDIEVIELPFEDAYHKLHTGEIKDAKTTILLLYAKIHIFPGEKVFDIL